jgi:hypothetical protein
MHVYVDISCIVHVFEGIITVTHIIRALGTSHM